MAAGSRTATYWNDQSVSYLPRTLATKCFVHSTGVALYSSEYKTAKTPGTHVVLDHAITFGHFEDQSSIFNLLLSQVQLGLCYILTFSVFP